RIASTTPAYKNLVNLQEGIVDIINQPNYIQMVLTKINKDTLKNIFQMDDRFVDLKLTQVEANPYDLEYSKKPTSIEFIHYLYNIDYYSENNVNTNKKCYHINPKIVEILVSPNTINAKNSEGNTPLHLAINIGHAELVKILVSKGAIAKSFRNNLNLTPFDMAIKKISTHVNYVDGDKVIDTINNFVVPFNNLLLERLRDERYGLNVIKNINLAIPIQLVVYNHMFHVYMENYNYHFDYELVTAVHSMYKNHLNIETNIYPFDLFDIRDMSQISKIIEPEMIKSYAAKSIGMANQDKLKFHQNQLEMLNNQMNAFLKEERKYNDSGKINSINDIKNALKSKITKIRESMKDTMPSNYLPGVDKSLMISYRVKFDSVIRQINKRGLTITEFYDHAFSYIGKSRDVYLNIWNNYLRKDLAEAPSMLLSLANKLVSYLVHYRMMGSFTEDLKFDLDILEKFFELIKKYIESKDSYPNNLDDNPILEEEYKQITYLINLILTPVVRNIILSQAYEGLREMDVASTIIKDHSTILGELINTKIGGITLDEYLYKVIPRMAFKYYTTIYRNEEDPDRKIASSGELFIPIVQFVKANRIIMVTDDSTLIKNFHEYLLPFIANTYQNFINSLRLAVYGYERFLLNTYQLIKIFRTLS
ncbi:MAG: ankyrin repeat domain-containing protein, partial [Nitrososphaerota archaeon]